METVDLRLSAQRALLGRIHAEIRLIKIGAFGSEITLTVLVAGEPSGQLREDISEATSEIVADFPDATKIHERIETSDVELPIEDVVKEGWVYQRAE